MSTITSSIVSTIMETNAERELWIVVKEHERPPFWFPDEGVGNRLNRAARVVAEGRITPNSDGSFTVEGSEGRTYRVADRCSCPNASRGKSHWCYHHVAVALYVEWCRRQRTSVPPLGSQVLASDPDDDALESGYPVDDETLPLPLPPTTAEERLAAPGVQEPRGAPMTEDPSPYIPEPAEAPVAVAETAVSEPPRVTIPAEYVMQIQGKRHVLYAGLVLGAQRSGLLSLSADWTYNDADLSLAHAVATFSDGRRYEDSGDASPSNVNKGIAKHFRRVALTRAKARCLRDALGIQECSVEELEEETRERAVPDLSQAPRPREQSMKQRIWAIVKARAPEATSLEAVTAWIAQETGYELHPNNYQKIMAILEGR